MIPELFGLKDIFPRMFSTKYPGFYKENRQGFFILAAALLLGFLMRFINLSGARFSWTDEYFTMDWSSLRYPYWCVSVRYPFLSVGYKLPLLLWGKFESVAIHTTAAWGMVTLLLTFVAGSVLFDSKTGGYGAFFLSLSTVHIASSRSAFPPVFQTVWLLAAFICFSLYFIKEQQKTVYLALTGVFSGLAFWAYTASYSAIASLMFLAFFFQCRNQPFKTILFRLAVIICAFLTVIAAFEMSERLLHHRSLLAKMISDSSAQRQWLFYPDNSPRPWHHFSRSLIFFKEIILLGGYFQFALTVFGYLYGIRVWFQSRNKGLLLLLCFITIGF